MIQFLYYLVLFLMSFMDVNNTSIVETVEHQLKTESARMNQQEDVVIFSESRISEFS